MSDEWKTCVIAPIFKGKGVVMSCGSYREVKLLEHAMKIVERAFERQIQTLINLVKCNLNLCQKNEQWMQYLLGGDEGGISKEEQEVVYVFW